MMEQKISPILAYSSDSGRKSHTTMWCFRRSGGRSCIILRTEMRWKLIFLCH